MGVLLFLKGNRGVDLGDGGGRGNRKNGGRGNGLDVIKTKFKK